MSQSYETQGIIHSIDQTREYGNNGFTKREFVIKVTGEGENPDYPNFLALELIKDKCSLMDAYKVGDEVKVQFNLTGRLWQPAGKPERCFNALQAWRVESLSGQAPEDFNQASGFDENQFMNQMPDDDIPF